MKQNDKLENYIYIRHKLFRINAGIPNIQPKQLSPWTKGALELDFGKGASEKITVVKDPKLLSEELKYLYIKYLEMRIYKWDKLI